jgi:hypothetical protein
MSIESELLSVEVFEEANHMVAAERAIVQKLRFENHELRQKIAILKLNSKLDCEVKE